jgi:hypothetical protein
MATTHPMVDRNFDSEAAESLVVTVPHGDVLNVKDHEWGVIHGSDRVLFLAQLWLGLGPNVLPAEVDGHLADCGYSLALPILGFLVTLLPVVFPPFRPTSIAWL